MSLTRNLLGVATGHTIPAIPSQGRQSCQLPAAARGLDSYHQGVVVNLCQYWRRNYPAETPLSRGLAAY